MYFIGIEAFLAIVESGSVSKASEILHVSQSTVSYRLKNLESELGFKLLERNQGIQGINLTDQGYSYLAIAEKIIEIHRETEKIRDISYKKNIVIGTADSISQYLLPEFYESLMNEFAEIRPFILTQHTLESYESIKLREIDFGFVKREYSMPGVFVKKIIDEEMVLVRLSGENDCENLISPDDLNAEDEIFMDWGYAYQVWHDNWWKPNSYFVRVDSAAMVFEMLKRKNQWAIVPKSVFNVFSKTGLFSEQRLSSVPPRRSCYMIRNKNLNKFQEMIFEFMERYFECYE